MLFIIAKNYNHFQGLLIGEWLSDICYTHLMKHHAYELVWKDLQDVFLSEKASFRTMNKAWSHLCKKRQTLDVYRNILKRARTVHFIL